MWNYENGVCERDRQFTLYCFTCKNCKFIISTLVGMRLIICICICLLYWCCNNTQAQETTNTPPLWKTDIYRHYTGTIGDRPVALDLRWGCCLSNFGGSNYYYLDSDEAYLLSVPNPANDEPSFSATVYPSMGHWGFGEKPYPQWQFSIFRKRLTGTLYGVGGKAPQAIDLTEDYTQAYPMTMSRIRDTATRLAKDGTKCLAETFFVVPLPGTGISTEDAAYINSNLLHYLGAEHSSIEDLDNYARATSEQYITNFRNRKEIVNNNDSRFRDVMVLPSYDTTVIIFPVYNHDGIIVFNIHTRGVRDGNKRTYRDNYLCMDVPGQRTWTFDDILLRDDDRLSVLLENELKKALNIPASDALRNPVVVGRIPVTDNIIISQHGLRFHYQREEILNDKYGDMFITIPYRDLDSILKEEFKKRMGLQL